MVVRARAVKAELSDTEGLRFKLEERQQNILELKMTLKLKVGLVPEIPFHLVFIPLSY